MGNKCTKALDENEYDRSKKKGIVAHVDHGNNYAPPYDYNERTTYSKVDGDQYGAAYG